MSSQYPHSTADDITRCPQSGCVDRCDCPNPGVAGGEDSANSEEPRTFLEETVQMAKKGESIQMAKRGESIVMAMMESILTR